MDFNLLYRKAVLAVAGNRAVSATAQRVGMKLGASRFVAGETLDQALAVVADLNRRGILVTMDQLGEGVHEERVAREMCQAYLDLLDGIARTGVNANVSLKLTQMGLSFNRALTDEILLTIARKAAGLGNFVRIDMEDTPYTDATLEIYRHLRQLGFDNVGTVIQSYLYRTEKDIADLMQLGANLRIVKGAYSEPPHLAFPKKADVDENYKKVIATLLENGHYTAAATHDEKIIDWMKNFARERNIDKSRFEIQMLFGIRTPLQEELAREGYRVRCYVPFGRMWYPYFTRRIAERPGNFWFVVKNMIKG
ncbi:MAG TPA: proline dehydrogenase family protein [Symbiobacteriaceae bacterium]|nr:proline dehydrogenase family protein [Symbiobacteriaceae bacterium]